ncbi:rubrerythrin family protein [Citroniella saccharovorans]|uniref:Rubrerythrin family protein n=1 Tax=Citroniella saccharovorans TaxID=2053367 RepID=A0AAW9MVB7_9FIRM|nr:rubrerythrin family protein [Citroniella saccharovorans]MEB3430051.1 rubrerythrin family protein [Citroniella saccharovorans]
MKDMTAANLRSAYGGESQARTRYNIWGDVAEKDGFKNVAKLFRATSDAEKIHATLHFKALKDVKGDYQVTAGAGFGIGTTSENLQGAIDGELFEANEMYPAFIHVAEMQNEDTAVRAMKFAIEAEKVHAKMFEIAKEYVDKKEDVKLKDGNVYLCPICGFVSLDGEEDKCPICGATRDKFIAY